MTLTVSTFKQQVYSKSIFSDKDCIVVQIVFCDILLSEYDVESSLCHDQVMTFTPKYRLFIAYQYITNMIYNRTYRKFHFNHVTQMFLIVLNVTESSFKVLSSFCHLNLTVITNTSALPHTTQLF